MDKINVTIDFDELKELRDRLEQADRVLDRIYQNVMTQPGEDEHGNVGRREAWLENVYNGTRAALSEAGYAVYKAPYMLPIMPGLTEQGEADTEGIQMPEFVRDRCLV